MATYAGRDAKVVLGTYTVAEMGTWSVDMSSAEIDVSAFGDTWGKKDVGMKDWTITFSGSFDLSDATGQALLDSAWRNASALTNIKLYVDNTSYYEPDQTTVTGSCLVTSMRVGQDKGGVGTIEFTLGGSGALEFV